MENMLPDVVYVACMGGCVCVWSMRYGCGMVVYGHAQECLVPRGFRVI